MVVFFSIFDSSLMFIIYVKYKWLLNKVFYKKGFWCFWVGQYLVVFFVYIVWNFFILCVILVNVQWQDVNGEWVGDVNFLCNSIGIIF